jgi:hypothetical protein
MKQHVQRQYTISEISRIILNLVSYCLMTLFNSMTSYNVDCNEKMVVNNRNPSIWKTAAVPSMEVLQRCSPGETGKNLETLRMVNISAEIQNGHHQTASLHQSAQVARPSNESTALTVHATTYCHGTLSDGAVFIRNRRLTLCTMWQKNLSCSPNHKANYGRVLRVPKTSFPVG